MLILRLPDGGDLEAFARAAVSAGVEVVEVTIDTPGALDWLGTSEARKRGELVAGLGTVRRPEDLSRALQVEPDFVVSPTVDREVIAQALAADVMPIPGALTPTEIAAAHDNGAPVVKLFPAATMGPGYVSAVRAPLRDVHLMPVGGIDVSNAGAMIAAGASAVAVGSSAASQRDAHAGDVTAVEERLRAIVEEVRAAAPD